MNSRQLIHVWAQQNPAKQSGKSGNLSYAGASLWSYSMKIAHFVSATVCLVTSLRRSVTTTGHTSAASSAIPPDIQTFHVWDVNADTPTAHRSNFDQLAKEIDNLIGQLPRKRDKTYLIGQIQKQSSTANEYAKTFKLRCRHTLPADLLQFAVEQSAKIKRREQLADAKNQREFAKLLRKWMSGELDNLWPVSCRLKRAYLRLSGDTVQTSLGAEFPLSHCKRALTLVRQCVADQTGWERNGQSCPIGLFQIDSISPEGTVVAGCHTIDNSEIERFAKVCGL